MIDMKVTITPYTFILQDTNFYYECYKGFGFTSVESIVDFVPEKGYISLKTNIGELPFVWNPDNYKSAEFTKDLEVSVLKEDIDLPNFTIDDLYFSREREDDELCINVIDKRNDAFKATLVLTENGILLVKRSSFSNPARKYQMLYYAERNKNSFRAEYTYEYEPAKPITAEEYTARFSSSRYHHIRIHKKKVSSLW